MSTRDLRMDKSNINSSQLDSEFAIRAAGLGVWEMDVERQTLNWDEQCNVLFGTSAGNSVSFEQALSNVYPEDISNVRNGILRVLDATSSTHYEAICRIKTENSESIRWVRFTGRSTVDDSGVIERFAGVAQDVTDDVVRNHKAEQNESKFRNLIQNAPFAIAVYQSKDLVIDIANEAMIRLWGKTASVLGMKLAEALPELDGQPFLNILENVFDSGITYSTNEQEVLLVVDGKLQGFWFNFTYEPLVNSEGSVYAILNMAVDVTERMNARKLVEESRTKLLNSFEQSPVAIAIISAENFVFEIANKFYCDLVGRSPEQIIGKSLLEALPELEGQGFDILLKNVVDTGTPFLAPEISVDLIRNNQLEKIYVDLTYQPQYASNGEITDILVVATHVTQQVTARQRIEASETKLKSVIASAPAAMGLFLGRDLIIDLPNQAFIDIVGKGPDIVGKPLREVMPELIGQPFLEILDNVFTSGKMFQSYGSQVHVMFHGKMTHGYYNITYTPLFNDAGEVYAILEIAIDVTEEMLAKQKIAEAEERLRGAVELAEMATWTLDINKNVFVYSQRFMDWLGFSEETTAADVAYNPIPDEFRLSVEKAIHDTILPGSTGLYENEHPIVNRNTGQERIIHAQAKVFYDGDGNPALLSGTAMDVTEQRKIQLTLERQVQERTEELEASNEELAATNEELAATNEEFVTTNEDLAEANNLLIRSNENLEQFAYIASHDLQEPLRKIRQFGDLLRQQHENPTGQSLMYLDRMQSAALRMSTLIEDLLTFARISSNKEETELIALNEVVQAVMTDLELRINETQAVIEILPLSAVNGDKVQLSQLFSNLLSNALKFRRQDVTPNIIIRSALVLHSELPPLAKPTRWSAYYHRIEVVDNGIGFDEQYTERIFQVFQRLHGKSEFSGTGVGLAICEKVAANHGGAITASSTKGSGATFQVFLPTTVSKPTKMEGQA